MYFLCSGITDLSMSLTSDSVLNTKNRRFYKVSNLIICQIKSKCFPYSGTSLLLQHNWLPLLLAVTLAVHFVINR